jgi:hypothetical protein
MAYAGKPIPSTDEVAIESRTSLVHAQASKFRLGAKLRVRFKATRVANISVPEDDD